MVEGVVIDTSGRRFERGSLVQSIATGSGGGSGVEGPEQTIISLSGRDGKCVGDNFECWSVAQKGGVLAVVIVVGVGVLLGVWLLMKKCIGKKKKGEGESFSSDSERGGGGGGDKGVLPSNPMQPMALVPGAGDDGEKHGNRRGALFLWGKKRFLKDTSRPSSTTAVYNSSYSAPSVFVTPAAPTVRTIITPAGGVQYAPLPQQYSSSGNHHPIYTRDFAYPGANTSNRIQRLPPIATADDNSSEQQRKEEVRALIKHQNNLSLRRAAGGLRDRRSEEQKTYDRGHRNRRRNQRSRSQMSENYERRGDRLRKESPEAKEEERAERRASKEDSNRLRGRRRSSGAQSANERARNIMLGLPRNSVRGRRRSRSDSAGGRRYSKDRRDTSTDHVYEIADLEKRGLLRKESGKGKRLVSINSTAGRMTNRS